MNRGRESALNVMQRSLRISSWFAMSWLAALVCGALPAPQEGLRVPRERADAIRAQMLALRDDPLPADPQRGIRAGANEAVKRWPAVKAEAEPHVKDILDLLGERNQSAGVPSAAIEASKKLGEMLNAPAKRGFIFFLTAEPSDAATAYDILDVAGRVPRWGWYNWDGANRLQIHYGQYACNAAFALDFCWEGWTPEQQQRVVSVVAERAVQSYWRIVRLSPFMGLHRLRSKNRGNNAISGALCASIAVGESVPENRIWFASLFQPYMWLVAHDIGWAGTGLELRLVGYRSVSMQNLYTAAVCLNNARGMDVRVHHGFAEATWYPIMKEISYEFIR